MITKPITASLLALVFLLALLMTATMTWGQQTAAPTSAPSPAAQAKAPGAPKQEYPLHISAAQMEANQDKRIIIFTGQVKADYGDSTLYSDKLLIFYKPEDKTRLKGRSPAPGTPPGKAQETSPLVGLSAGQIDRIEAWGHVRCVQGERVATGEKAIYYKDRDEIVLLGHPQVWRGPDYMKGSKIIMHLDTNKVEVESSPAQRVEAHLYPANQGKTPAPPSPSGSQHTIPRTGRPK